MTAASAALAPTNYLDRALQAVQRLGIPSPGESSAPAVAIASRLAVIDEARTVMVCRVLQQAPYFNEIVRDNLTGTAVSARFEKIVADFDSIRLDAKRMLAQADRGKLKLEDYIQSAIMNLTRRSIPTRFKNILKSYREVYADAQKGIDKGQAILNAYHDYRLGVKQGEIAASEIMEAAQRVLAERTTELEAAQKAVTSLASEASPADLARLELTRDEAYRAQQESDKVFQTAKSLAENLHVAYDTTDIVMARMTQTLGVREKVYEAAVTFMSTNETTLTAITAAYINQMSLHEETQTLEATRRGASDALETLAEIGGKTLTSGIKAAHGANYRVESVRKLVDSVVQFQLDSVKQIAEERRLTTENAKDIRAAVEDGRRRLVELTAQASS